MSLSQALNQFAQNLGRYLREVPNTGKTNYKRHHCNTYTQRFVLQVPL